MKFKSAYMDSGALIVMVITFVLFVAALFFKGVTHDLFVEAGVFLVSVKIIIMAYKTKVYIKSVDAKLDTILETMKGKDPKEI